MILPWVPQKSFCSKIKKYCLPPIAFDTNLGNIQYLTSEIVYTFTIILDVNNKLERS